MKKLILTLLISLIVISIIAAGLFATYVITTNKAFLKETHINIELDIKNGDTFRSVYKKIYKGIKVPYMHYLYLTKIMNIEKKIKTGYYQSNDITLEKLIEVVIDGKQTLIKVTIPEGYNLFDIGTLLQKLYIMPKDEFVTAAFDRQLIEYLLKEDYESFEGFLFPGTYYVPKEFSPKEAITLFYQGFKDNLPKDFKKKVEARGLTFYQALILTSIVQKETYSKEESDIVASVFYNRLKLNMRLQADPTIIYGKYISYDGNIRKKDILNAENKFNTYRHSGLPPTPISNPGVIALEAVMNPKKTDYLYFVADDKGQHLFSATYREHVNNVNKYHKKK